MTSKELPKNSLTTFNDFPKKAQMKKPPKVFQTQNNLWGHSYIIGETNTVIFMSLSLIFSKSVINPLEFAMLMSLS